MTKHFRYRETERTETHTYMYTIALKRSRIMQIQTNI